MTQKIEILDQNFAHFGGFEGLFLAIFGVKKVIFWTFSMFFSNRLRIVKAIFLTFFLESSSIGGLRAPKGPIPIRA